MLLWCHEVRVSLRVMVLRDRNRQIALNTPTAYRRSPLKRRISVRSVPGHAAIEKGRLFRPRRALKPAIAAGLGQGGRLHAALHRGLR